MSKNNSTESSGAGSPRPDPKQMQSRMRSMLILYLVFFLGLQAYTMFFAPKKATEPAQQASLKQQAAELEKAAASSDTSVSTSDRIKNLEEANKRYENYLRENEKAPDAPQVHFNIVNNYDRLAQLQSGGNNHYYDQAEQKLKDLEKRLHGKTGSVKLVVNGQEVQKSGELGDIATERLDTIRAARDVRNNSKITWKVLDVLVAATGRNPAISYALALAFMVIFLKVITYPFFVKQYEYQRDMARVQPLIVEMREKMKNRPPEEVNRRMMEIYREQNVSLLGGCLPMFVSGFALLPVFYVVRDYEYQFTKATFLWIGSEMSRQYWWLADNLAQFDVPLFLLYIASQLLYPLTQPKPADPQQAKQQQLMLIMMPIMFGVFMWMYKWSSAFVLYWLVLNVVSLYQAYLVKKKLGAPPPLVVAGASASGSNHTESGSAPAPVANPTPMADVHTPRRRARKKKSQRPDMMSQMPQAPKSREVRRRMR